MEDACAALLVGDTGFRTEGAGVATTGTTFMLPYLRMPKSRELAFPARLWLRGCRPPMLVRVARERGRMQRALILFVRAFAVGIGRQGL